MSRSVVDKLGVKEGLKVCVVGNGDYLLPKLMERDSKENRLLSFKEWRTFGEASNSREVDVVLFWTKKKDDLELFFREVRRF